MNRPIGIFSNSTIFNNLHHVSLEDLAAMNEFSRPGGAGGWKRLEPSMLGGNTFHVGFLPFLRQLRSAVIIQRR